jgi:hypothetical protein
MAALQPAPSSMPGLAVRVLLLQATASSQLQDHEDAIQVRQMQSSHLAVCG